MVAIDNVKYPATNGALSQELVQQAKICLQVDLAANVDTCCEFTQDEMRSAFGFLDLDRNGYIGAAEIRHILISMGELVTDEEIDMMIHMLDSSGDGQVSLQQFKAMVQSSDPANDNLQPPVKARANLNMDNFEYKKEDERRATKRKVISSFVLNNNIQKEDIHILKEYFISKVNAPALVDGKNSSFVNPWNIDFEHLCKILPIEVTGETQHLFNIIDNDGSGIIDVRELVISLGNFIEPYTIEDRCRTMFELYDFDKSGSLSLADMENILVGTHLMTRKAILVRKAQTIMKYLDTDKLCKITPQELLVATRKFPNLIFPKHYG